MKKWQNDLRKESYVIGGNRIGDEFGEGRTGYSSTNQFDFVALSGEQAVNSQTSKAQEFPRSAFFSDGRYIIVWGTQDSLQDGSGGAIKAQIFAADGTKIGGEFRVNTQTASTQDMATVAVLENDNFVISWHTINATQDGNSGAIKAQTFDNAGVRIGSEFLVNTISYGNQYRPDILNLSNGGYVISWIDANSYKMKAQIFDASGNRVGSEFQVSTANCYGTSTRPIAELNNGNIVFTWQSAPSSGDSLASAATARIFSENGTAITGQFLVNTQLPGDQANLSVSALSNGNFIVVWLTTDTTQDGSGNALKGQLFDESGVKIGSEFLVNSIVTGNQSRPVVVATNDGGYFVAWQTSDTTQDGSGTAIKGQGFAADGTAVGGEIRINTLATGDQTVPHLSVGPSGEILATWVSASGDGSLSGIRSQILVPLNTAPITTSDGSGDTASISMDENAQAVTLVTPTDLEIMMSTHSTSSGDDANTMTGALSLLDGLDFEMLANAYDINAQASDDVLICQPPLTISWQQRSTAFKDICGLDDNDSLYNGVGYINTNKDQAFSFIDVAALSGVAGQSRYKQTDGNSFVMSDVNDDGAADFYIKVNGLHAFAATDFIL